MSIDSNTIKKRRRPEPICIAKGERGTGVSWWVGVPRGDAWRAACAWADEQLNPPTALLPMPKGGVFKS